MNKVLDYNTYKEHITHLNPIIGISEEHTKTVLDICKKICASPVLTEKFFSFQERYFAGDYEHREELAEAGAILGCSKQVFSLAVCEMYTLHTLEIYKQRGYDIDPVYYDSMRDIHIWANVCLSQHGMYGIENYGWVNYQISCNMFRLGRMQYHFIDFGREIEYCGIKLHAKSRVINIHIPEGDALTTEKRLDSYKKAYNFFKQTGHAVFVCDSWLLYPGHYDFLPEKSNIIGFMNDFTILSNTEKPAITFGDLWRVYGFMESYEYDKLPKNSGLQKAYAERIKNGENLGCGFGIFVFDGENIIK